MKYMSAVTLFALLFLSSPSILCSETNQTEQTQETHDLMDNLDLFDGIDPDVLEEFLEEHPIEYHDPAFYEIWLQKFLSWLLEQPYVLDTLVAAHDWWYYIPDESATEADDQTAEEPENDEWEETEPEHDAHIEL